MQIVGGELRCSAQEGMGRGAHLNYLELGRGAGSVQAHAGFRGGCRVEAVLRAGVGSLRWCWFPGRSQTYGVRIIVM